MPELGEVLNYRLLIRSDSKNFESESAMDPVCNQISEFGSAADSDKILLGVAFILKAMPKPDHLGVLF